MWHLWWERHIFCYEIAKKSPLKWKMISNIILIQISSLEIKLFVENSLLQVFSTTILCCHYVTFWSKYKRYPHFFWFTQKEIDESLHFLNLHGCTIQQGTKNKYIYGKYRSNRQNYFAFTPIFLCHWPNGTKFLFSAFCPHKSKFYQFLLLNGNLGNETALISGKQGRI